MANYTYIAISVVHEDFLNDLRGAVARTLDSRWEVRIRDNEPTFEVYLPDTAVDTLAEANKRYLAPNEDVGFSVALQHDRIAFRHGLNQFERWAQGRVEEELADFYNVGVFDATDKTRPPGTRIYRTRQTYFEYLSRNFKRPLSTGDSEYLETFRYQVPEGHWRRHWRKDS
jgi:hypothetical protein